jgi:hypothetical protein
MPQVISASRRTDIPAFYPGWFLNRLKAGYVFVKNPYSQKLFRVSLRPEDVSAFVFWSKNYSPLLSKLESVEKTTKNLFFHFTITANNELELDTPYFSDAIRDYLFIVRRYSSEQIVWRYDPICITDKLPFEVHEERFMRCAEMLMGYSRKCIISFVHPYKKVLANLEKHTDHTILELSTEKKKEYAIRLATRADAYGIQLYTCCNDYLLSNTILKASCIDGQYLSTTFKTAVDTRQTATRKECACTISIDIGAYDTCAHGCIYCYANSDKDKAREAQQRQNLEWNALGVNVTEDADFAREAQHPLFERHDLLSPYRAET